jgi:hypothetical protein
MKKFVSAMVAAMPVIFLSVHVHAQGVTSFTHNVGISATVPKICSFEGNVTPSGPPFSITDNENSLFAVQINSQTSTVMNATGSISFTNAFCNTASNATLSRDGLTSGVTASGTFDSQIYYHAKLLWDSSVASIHLSPLDTVLEKTAPLGPIDGNLDIIIEVKSTDNTKLLPGNYTDTLSLTITPQL